MKNSLGIYIPLYNEEEGIDHLESELAKLELLLKDKCNYENVRIYIEDLKCHITDWDNVLSSPLSHTFVLNVYVFSNDISDIDIIKTLKHIFANDVLDKKHDRYECINNYVKKMELIDEMDENIKFDKVIYFDSEEMKIKN